MLRCILLAVVLVWYWGVYFIDDTQKHIFEFRNFPQSAKTNLALQMLYVSLFSVFLYASDMFSSCFWWM